MEKWEHKLFWAKMDMTFHSLKKRDEMGDGFFVLEEGTPFKKPRINDKMRKHCGKILRRVERNTGERVLFLPVKLVKKHPWVEPGHVMYVNLDELAVEGG